MDLSFEFSILLNLNKGIDLKKVCRLEKITPIAWYALRKNLKKKEKKLIGIIFLGTTHGTKLVVTAHVLSRA